MMMATGHDLHLLTGSYALDALPEGERAEFEKHLRRCPSCAEEVRSLRETAARLALATAIAPPPQMRERVLAAVPRTRQLPPLPGRHALDRTGLRRLPLSRAGAGVSAAVLALAAAVAFLFVSNVSTNNQLHQSQATASAVASVLAAPDARVQAVSAAGGGTVTAVTSVHRQEAVVTSASLPALAGARVYQLWVLTAGGAARSAGLLTVSVSGTATPHLADGVSGGDKLAITVEPAGGTAQPTTTPVVIMPVTA
jgi:anti-sigma-K factor RskA